jgi:preprotein translocase subunit SecD
LEAIEFNAQMISDPAIEQPQFHGVADITGGFTAAQAHALAQALTLDINTSRA